MGWVGGGDRQVEVMDFTCTAAQVSTRGKRLQMCAVERMISADRLRVDGPKSR